MGEYNHSRVNALIDTARHFKSVRQYYDKMYTLASELPEPERNCQCNCYADRSAVAMDSFILVALKLKLIRKGLDIDLAEAYAEKIFCKDKYRIYDLVLGIKVVNLDGRLVLKNYLRAVAAFEKYNI